jgi:hypothetical protein
MESVQPPTIEQLARLVHARAPENSADARLRAAIGLGRELTDTGDALVERFVAEARAAGLSWSEIGALFGTSKQAAQKRYGPTETAPAAWPGCWTPAAHRALNHAGEQARALGHNHVGTEHALLGLLAARDGLAARVLADLGITREAVLDELPGPCEPREYQCLGVRPRPKQSLEHARRIAGRFGHQVAGTEHLLAGILAVPDALAVEILECRGISADAARSALAKRLDVDAARLLAAHRRRRRRRLLARTR